LDNEKFQELVLQQFDKVFDKLNSMENRLESVEQGQTRLETRMESVEQGQTCLETRLESVEQGQLRLETRMESVEQGQTRLETRLESVEQGQLRLETRLESVEKGQIRLESRMESEVTEKIRALFDSREVHMDYFVSIRDSQARIEEKLDILVDRAIDQDKKLDNHERELRLLRIEK